MEGCTRGGDGVSQPQPLNQPLQEAGGNKHTEDQAGLKERQEVKNQYCSCQVSLRTLGEQNTV